METPNKEYIRFDWAMKRLLRDKANFQVLEGLLTALLGTKVRILNILESSSNRLTAHDKSNTVDVKAENEKGEIFVVEVQNLFQMDFLKRSLYGASRAVTEQVSIGEDFRKIKKVYAVAIAYFDLGVGKDYLFHGTTHLVGVHTGEELGVSLDERDAYDSDVASDAFPEYWVLRVNEFDKFARTPLDEWMQYLKTGYIDDNTKDSGLIRAKEVLTFDAMSKDEQAEYRVYVNDLACQRDSINKAHNDGKAEGKLEEKLEIARNMKVKGYPTDVIADITTLTPEEIDKL